MMKFTINQSFEEMLETLIADAGVQPHDESIIRAALSEHEAYELQDAYNEIENANSIIADLKEPPELSEDEVLNLDDDGAVTRIKGEQLIGTFGDIEDGETSFQINSTEQAKNLTGTELDQLARLKSIWVNQ